MMVKTFQVSIIKFCFERQLRENKENKQKRTVLKTEHL